jgi:hypothetical protein
MIIQDKQQADSTDGSAVPPKLKKQVKQFKVCWEVLPDNYYVRGQIRQIGFDLALTGTHEAGVEHPEPGCEHCRNVRQALQDIAHWIIPKERRDSDYDITPYDQAIHYDPSRKFRPEVTLQIWIRHRSGFDREVDACEVRCLKEMTQKLKAIGAREGKWEFD